MRSSKRWWAAVLLWGVALIAEARPGKEGFSPLAYRPLVRFRHKVSIFPISLANPFTRGDSCVAGYDANYYGNPHGIERLWFDYCHMTIHYSSFAHEANIRCV